MEIAMSNTRSKFPLSSKKPLKKTLSKVPVIIIVLFVILFTAFTFFGLQLSDSLFNTSSLLLGIVGFFIITIAISFIVYIYQYVYYLYYYYEFTENFVIIRKGVFAQSEVTIQYNRIQDVYVDQDILDRFFGLYDVHISTATTASGYLAHIDGVEKDGADGLKEILLSSIKSKRHEPQNNTSPPVNQSTSVPQPTQNTQAPVDPPISVPQPTQNAPTPNTINKPT